MDTGFNIEAANDLVNVEPTHRVVLDDGTIALQPFQGFITLGDDGLPVVTDQPSDALAYIAFIPGYEVRRGDAGNLRLTVLGAQNQQPRRGRGRGRGRQNQQNNQQNNRAAKVAQFGLGSWLAVVKVGVAGLVPDYQVMYGTLGKDPSEVEVGDARLRTFTCSPPSVPRAHERQVASMCALAFRNIIGIPPVGGKLAVETDIASTVDAMRSTIPGQFGKTTIDSSGLDTTIAESTSITLLRGGEPVERRKAKQNEDGAGSNAGTGSFLDDLEALEAEAASATK